MVDDGAECFICDDAAEDAHHIVPRRMGGCDDDRNLVDLCRRCHQKVEKIYDNRFISRFADVLREEGTVFELIDRNKYHIEIIGFDGMPKGCHADGCFSRRFETRLLKETETAAYLCRSCETLHY